MAKNDELPYIKPFNPLDKKNLAESVADAVLSSPVHPLPPGPFKGAGVYMIYYTGDFPPYESLAKTNRDGKYKNPIYVGKAVPDGARKGGQGFNVEPGRELSKRLSDHSKSIEAAQNLKLEDFHCRYLVVDDIWIPLAESLLIEKFAPLWNIEIDGFGNHNPGSGRHKSKKSLWDCLHPGRDWAEKLEPCRKTVAQVEDMARTYISQRYKNQS